VKTKSYAGMRRLAENREEWRAATNQSLGFMTYDDDDDEQYYFRFHPRML
jgi:hypothetical protein